MKNLAELLKISAGRFPSRIALVFGQKKISYEELDVFSDRLAQGLRESGIGRSDPVAVLLDNSPHFVISYFAIVKLGAIIVPINHMLKEEELEYILSDSAARLLITSVEYLDMVLSVKNRCTSLKKIVLSRKVQEGVPSMYEWVYDPLKKFAGVDIAPGDCAAILYTSGTTGRPKGAMLSHGNLLANVRASAKAICATKKDKAICVLSLFHSFAATVCMLLPLSVGGGVVLMKSVRPFRRVLRAILRNKVTVFVGVPSLFSILNEVKLPWIVDSFIIRFLLPLRVCISGAAALPVPVWQTFQKRFRLALLEGYGLTEASPVVTLNPYRGVRKGGSIGIPIEGVEVEIVNNEGIRLNAGEVGELIVRGSNVMLGYYNKTQETQETIKDGWLYTGDLAKKGADGYVYIVGRKKDMVNVRGLNVYPREIEDLLCRHPAVAEAAVIGVADYHKGEVPKGFVVLKPDASVSGRELIVYLRQHLANYKVPRVIEVRKDLPRNATGKILKRVLIEQENKNTSSSEAALS